MSSVPSVCTGYVAYIVYVCTCIVKVFLGIGQFVVVVLASVIIGFVIGMIAAFITRFSEHVHGKCHSICVSQ